MISIIGFAHNVTHTVARGWARRKAVLYRPMMMTTDDDDSRRLLLVCLFVCITIVAVYFAKDVSSSTKRVEKRFACQSGKLTLSRYNHLLLVLVIQRGWPWKIAKSIVTYIGVYCWRRNFNQKHGFMDFVMVATMHSDKNIFALYYTCYIYFKNVYSIVEQLETL